MFFCCNRAILTTWLKWWHFLICMDLNNSDSYHSYVNSNTLLKCFCFGCTQHPVTINWFLILQENVISLLYAAILLDTENVLPISVNSWPVYIRNWSVVSGGVVAEWVRALDWRPGGPGFESRCANFASELWQCCLPLFASVFRRRH